MIIDYKSPAVRFTGRFAELDGSMTTTAAGSQIEIAFCGEQILLKFDLNNQVYPYPHLWLRLDGGAWTEAQVDWYLRIMASTGGNHYLEIIVKSAVESQNRWEHPIEPKVSFISAEASEISELPADTRKTIEILGDSITEGVLTDPVCDPFGNGNSRVYEDDIFATYGWLTAKALNLKPLISGYGGIGLTKGGSGAIPEALSIYDYCFKNAPVTYGHPDYILLNYGTNDYFSKSAEEYIKAYTKLLEHIVQVHPASKITVLTGFSGVFPSETKKLVDNFNKTNGTDVFFIDSTGWIPPRPLHPQREGHKIVATHLTEALQKRFNL